MPRFDRQVVHNPDVLYTKLQYIQYNPVKRGLVEKPEDWKWSSAKSYDSGVDDGIEIWKGWW